jgi:multidrug efflux pump subunit AcrB
VEKILANTPGIEYTTSVVGFSLLSSVRTSYNAFFFVNLKPWDERKSRSEQYQAIKARLNQELRRLPAGTVLGFSPPAEYRLSSRTTPGGMFNFYSGDLVSGRAMVRGCARALSKISAACDHRG